MTKALRKTMISTICMLVVAVLSLTGVTYAWFTTGTTATVTGVEVTVEAADGGIQIRTFDGNSTGNWVNTLPLSFTGIEGFKALSSADGDNFYTIARDATNNTIYTVRAATTDEKANNVLIQGLQFTNPGSNDVQIVLNDEGSDIASSIGKINEAVRVAFIVENYDEDGKSDPIVYIWAPYDGSYAALIGETSEAKDWASVTPGDDNADVLKTVDTQLENEIIINLPSNPTMIDDDAHVVNVTMVIWLEGQDSNCANVNAGGTFEIGLKFEIK